MEKKVTGAEAWAQWTNLGGETKEKQTTPGPSLFPLNGSFEKLYATSSWKQFFGSNVSTGPKNDTLMKEETEAKFVQNEQDLEAQPLQGETATRSPLLNLTSFWKTRTEPTSSIPTLPWNVRFKYFVGLAMLSLLFFGLASMFLPLLAIRPSKFALSFTLGSLCCMGAFAMLKGPMVYMNNLIHPKNLAITSSYAFTLGFTLYSCLVVGNYALVVMSAIMQLMSLACFALSSIPGGTASLKAFGRLFWRTASGLIRSVQRL